MKENFNTGNKALTSYKNGIWFQIKSRNSDDRTKHSNQIRNTQTQNGVCARLVYLYILRLFKHLRSFLCILTFFKNRTEQAAKESKQAAFFSLRK